MISCPHRRKENQCVMNCQQSTSIPRNDHPENHNEEGSAPNLGQRCADRAGTGNSHFLAASDPIPKFASLRGTLVCELRNQRDTSNL